MPRTRNSIVRHRAVYDIAEVESTDVTILSFELSLVRRQLVILYHNSVDYVVVNDYLFRIFCVNALCDGVMDDIAIESHFLRVGDLYTLAQARKNCGIRHTLFQLERRGKVNCSLIGFV